MTRSFKFRIWDNAKGQFLSYGCWFHHLDPNEFSCFDRYFRMDEEKFVLQQSIGIRDKNGKDIYEGDYVNFSCNDSVTLGDRDISHWIKQEVYYDEQLAGFFFGKENSFQILDNIITGTLEVVGNIFENTELVRGVGHQHPDDARYGAKA